MNKLIVLALFGALLISLALAGAALAQTSTNYDLTWHVMGSGGGSMNSTSYAVRGTMGQVIVGDVGSPSYILRSQGYWYPSPGYCVYVPLALKLHP
jgi:hypothetical protein